MERIRRHFSYANIAATLALVFAMSGGALAATHYLINSTKQINPKVLKALKRKIGQSGPPGIRGPVGSAGPQGLQGPQGPAGPEGGSVGSWTAPLTVSSKLKQVSGFEELAVRTESAGATARLRGVLEVTGEVKAGEALFTVPAGFRPKSKVDFGIGVSAASGTNHVGSLLISTDGVVTDPETPVPPGVYYLFDGITWNLN
jgi:hypothetical protein